MPITVLPWYHDSELAFVRDCFYPHHVASSTTTAGIYAPPELSTGEADPVKLTTKNTQLSLERVQVWIFRSPRNVPHAIIATAALIEAMYYDSYNRSTPQGLPHHERISLDLSDNAITSLYAMAFLRFVNGFVDRDVSRATHRTGLSTMPSTSLDPDDADNDGSRDEEEEDNAVNKISTGRGGGESSMYAHAASIGLPSSFVDLRHQCAHGEPDLGRLRLLTQHALEWLWERWWLGNATGDPGRWIYEQGMMENGEAVDSDST